MSIKDTKEFHLTTSKELLAIKDRVRNLVDHWLEDGNYKEATLTTVIKRFLPKKYSIGTGFVVKQTETRGKHKPSKQIDLIVYDNSFPTLFKEGNFVIVTPDSVKAIIEVKANLNKQKRKKIIEKSNNIGKFICEGKRTIDNSLRDRDIVQGFEYQTLQRIRFFNGIFSFEGFERTSFENLKNYLVAESNTLKSESDFKFYCVNHISFNKDIFYKFWGNDLPQTQKQGCIYSLKNLSFSYFISNLMVYLSDSTISNNNLWFPDDKSLSNKVEFNIV
jgi:hypothetical protein